MYLGAILPCPIHISFCQLQTLVTNTPVTINFIDSMIVGRVHSVYRDTTNFTNIQTVFIVFDIDDTNPDYQFMLNSNNNMVYANFSFGFSKNRIYKGGTSITRDPFNQYNTPLGLIANAA